MNIGETKLKTKSSWNTGFIWHSKTFHLILKCSPIPLFILHVDIPFSLSSPSLGSKRFQSQIPYIYRSLFFAYLSTCLAGCLFLIIQVYLETILFNDTFYLYSVLMFQRRHSAAYSSLFVSLSLFPFFLFSLSLSFSLFMCVCVCMCVCVFLSVRLFLGTFF